MDARMPRWSLPSFIRSLLLRVLHRVEWWTAVRYYPVHGFVVRSSIRGKDGRVPIYRLEAGIEFLLQTRPRWGPRTRRDVAGILISPLIISLGQFMPRLRVIAIDSDALSGDWATPLNVALALVHEATHARIRAWHVRNTTANYIRIEQACVNQQIAFLDYLPSSTFNDQLIAYYRRLREEAEVHWGAEARQKRLLAALERQPFPDWLHRILRRRLETRGRQ